MIHLIKTQVQGETFQTVDTLKTVNGVQKNYAGVFGTVRGIIANEGPK